MINHVIKRNGKKTRFQPDKLNKLANWATEHNVPWSNIALNGLKKLSDGCTVRDIIQALIQACIDERTSAHLAVAGKLYVADLYKRVFADNNSQPYSLKYQLEKMYKLGYYQKFDYSDEELAEIDTWLNHVDDYKLIYTQIKQMESKYLVRDRVNDITYETPRFMYARIALAVFQKDPNRMFHIKKYLEYLQDCTLSLPTPNWTYLGTPTKTGASCCLYIAEDSDDSITAAEVITHKMTTAGAGLGVNVNVRSSQDSVKKGTIVHMGKLPYLRVHQASATSNKQGSRGGALNCFSSQNDPELLKIIKARNPTTVAENKVDAIDFAILVNPYLLEKARSKGSLDWMLISIHQAPDLYQAFYSDDLEEYKRIYDKYDNDSSVKKSYVKARDLLTMIASEAYETGRLYDGNVFEINWHSPFLEPIHSSNLCMEITLPTKPFHNVMKLYEEKSSEYAYLTLKGEEEELEIKDLEEAARVLKDVKVGDTYLDKEVLKVQSKNEIALCNIAAINVNRDFTLEEYTDRCYYALRTVDYVILNSKYPFPNVAYTAAKRMSAGIGMMNVAYEMARKGLYYSTTAGKQHSHFLAERHMYALIKASLKISKERGNAPWIHKTKWKDGWTPLDTYNRNVDTIADFTYTYDWKELKLEIISNGGIAHSALAAFMPGESSSQNLNATNSIYPIRQGNVLKTDGTKTNIFIAPEWERLELDYESAWDISMTDMTDHYAIYQKFTDQSISADKYRDFTKPGQETVSKKELLGDFAYKMDKGCKTQYYTNSKTNKKEDDEPQSACSGGGCSL